jgi:hypothetical protein
MLHHILQGPKLTKEDKHATDKNTALQKIDHGAIRIRERCDPPLNVFRTCYDRAIDPTNALEFDEIQLLTPFKTPFIDHDEWLITETFHIALTEFQSNSTTDKERCENILYLEEVAIKYLMVSSRKGFQCQQLVHIFTFS